MSQQSGNYSLGSGQSYTTVPTPSASNLSFFLNSADNNKLYAKNSKGLVFPIVTYSESSALIDVNTGFSDDLTFDIGEGTPQEIGGVGNVGNFIHTLPANTIKKGDIYRVTLRVPLNTNDVSFSSSWLGVYMNYQIAPMVLCMVNSVSLFGNNPFDPLPSTNGEILGAGGGFKVVAELQIIDVVNNIATINTTMTWINTSGTGSGANLKVATMTTDDSYPIDITNENKISFAGLFNGGLQAGDAKATMMITERLRK